MTIKAVEMIFPSGMLVVFSMKDGTVQRIYACDSPEQAIDSVQEDEVLVAYRIDDRIGVFNPKIVHTIPVPPEPTGQVS
jgi:hypothetical protein